jgi:hypothetical protein
MHGSIVMVRLHPSNYDGPEEDRTLGYYSSRDLAFKRAEEWIRLARAPHPDNHCGCVWVAQFHNLQLDRELIP